MQAGRGYIIWYVYIHIYVCIHVFFRISVRYGKVLQHRTARFSLVSVLWPIYSPFLGTRVWVYPLHCEVHSCSQSENVLFGSSINVLSLFPFTSKTSRIFQTAPRWDEKTCLGACNFTSIQDMGRSSLPSWLPSSSASSGWPEMHLGCIGQHNLNSPFT